MPSRCPQATPAWESECGQGRAEAQLTQKAKVLSTIDASPYITSRLRKTRRPCGLPANAIVKKGDVIRFDNSMVMTNFHSKTLNRTFPSVLFVNQVVVTNE